MTPENISSVQKDDQTKDAGTDVEMVPPRGKMRSSMRVMAKFGLLTNVQSQQRRQQPPIDIHQRRHTTVSTDDISRHSRGAGDSMFTDEGREQKRANSRSRSRASDPGSLRYHEPKKRQPRGSKSYSDNNITMAQSSRIAKTETVDEDDEFDISEEGCSLDWMLGQGWIIQGIMTALEGCSKFLLDHDSERSSEGIKGGVSETVHDANNNITALGYRVTSSGSLQFRKICSRNR